jgi:hypothetical protein
MTTVSREEVHIHRPRYQICPESRRTLIPLDEPENHTDIPLPLADLQP